MSAPRIAAGSRRGLGLPLWVIARVSGLVAGVDRPNLFLTIGRHMLATTIHALRIQPDIPNGRRTAGLWERFALGPVQR